RIYGGRKAYRRASSRARDDLRPQARRRSLSDDRDITISPPPGFRKIAHHSFCGVGGFTPRIFPVSRDFRIFNPSPGLPSLNGLPVTSTLSPGLRESLFHPWRLRLPGLVASIDHTIGCGFLASFTATQIKTCGLVH